MHPHLNYNVSLIVEYLDGALCLEHLFGRAATVALFKYRLMASVGDGFSMDKAEVQTYKFKRTKATIKTSNKIGCKEQSETVIRLALMVHKR